MTILLQLYGQLKSEFLNCMFIFVEVELVAPVCWVTFYSFFYRYFLKVILSVHNINSWLTSYQEKLDICKNELYILSWNFFKFKARTVYFCSDFSLLFVCCLPLL